MKTKITLLLAFGALFGVFGVSQAFAQEPLIMSIDKSMENNMEPTGPIAPGTKIYFDVRLKDKSSSNYRIVGNEYTPGITGERPYLILNVPFKGMSSKEGITTLEATEATQVPTDYAVAFYDKQKSASAADTLRFVYTVRPGDMAEAITWRTTDGTEDAAPVFGGALNKVLVKFERTVGDTTAKSLDVDWLKGASGNGIVVTDVDGNAKWFDAAGNEVPAGTAGAVQKPYTDGKTYTVSGYTMLVGDLGDNNEGRLYQGLVPVTVSTDGNAAATLSTDSKLQRYSFWVMALDTKNTTETTDDEWKYLTVPVTHMGRDSQEINAWKDGSTIQWETSFPKAPCQATYKMQSQATFTDQKFFVNIPTEVPDGTTVRLCYGIAPGTANAFNNYTYVETVVKETPVRTAASALLSYSLEASAGLSRSDGTEGKPHEISLAAGKSSVLTIRKSAMSSLSSYGKLYAVIEKLSDPQPTGGAIDATLSRSYVALDPYADPNNPFTQTLSVMKSATAGEGLYRIWIPGTTEETDTTKPGDRRVYFKLVTSTESVTIRLVPTESGTAGAEYFEPLDNSGTAGTLSVLPVDMIVPAGEMRTFKIFPVASDGKTEIKSDATIAVTEQMKNANGELLWEDSNGNATTTNTGTPIMENKTIDAYDLIGSYATVQSHNGVDPNPANAEPYTIVTVPEGETTVRFYVICRNDYAKTKSLLYGREVKQTNGTETLKLNGVTFKAARCDANGKVTGTNDICTTPVSPSVANRKPQIMTFNNNGSGAGVGTPVNFNFTVADAATDYLITQMVYGDGVTETTLYVDEAKMKKMMGSAWETELDALKGSYPDLKIETRTTEMQTLSFAHTYTTTGATWEFTIYDSTGASEMVSGVLALSKSQIFTFYTWDTKTRPAAGYVTWENDTKAPGASDYAWSFGQNYTYTSLPLLGATTRRAVAHAFSAGFVPDPKKDALNGFATISKQYDSFFYKWGTRNSKYDTLLPKEEYLYDATISIDRQFVGDGGGGGDMKDPTKWEDIELVALFVHEYMESDAKEAYTTEKMLSHERGNVYNFGDYNNDGVPDGWILDSDPSSTGRELVEGTSIADQQAEGDGLPAAGWEAGDAAYSMEYNAWNNGVLRGKTFPEMPFTYKMRIRGRHDHLNATEGVALDEEQGETSVRGWLSNPQWVVLIRQQIWHRGDGNVIHEDTKELLEEAGYPEKEAEEDALFPAVSVTDPMVKVYLATDKYISERGIANYYNDKIEFTENQRIPYDSTQIGADGWAPVVDNEGYTVKAPDLATWTEGAKLLPSYVENKYPVVSVYVQINEKDANGNPNPNYETFKTEYDRWVVKVPGDSNYKDVDKAKPAWKLPSVTTSAIDGLPREVTVDILKSLMTLDEDEKAKGEDPKRMGMFPFILEEDEVYATQALSIPVLEYSDPDVTKRPLESLVPTYETVGPGTEAPTGYDVMPRPYEYVDVNGDEVIDLLDIIHPATNLDEEISVPNPENPGETIIVKRYDYVGNGGNGDGIVDWRDFAEDLNGDGELTKNEVVGYPTAPIMGTGFAAIDDYMGGIAEGTGNSGIDGAYYYIDTRTPNGVLMDEPFEILRSKVTGKMDLRGGCWLDRYPMKDGAMIHGIPNGIHYYFWYYATRKAYLPIFSTTQKENSDLQKDKTYAVKTTPVQYWMRVSVDEATPGWLVNANGEAIERNKGESLQDYYARANAWLTDGVARVSALVNPVNNTLSNDENEDGVPDKTTFTTEDTGLPYNLVATTDVDAKGNYVQTHEIEEGNGAVRVQLNNALWPAIDVRNLRAENSDGALNLSNVFVMGRRYRNTYHPDNGDGMGSLWEPIPVEEVLDDLGYDPDNDGLTTAEELALGSNPIDFDSDGDGVPDGWAAGFGLDPTASVGGGNPDSDYFAQATVQLYSDYHHLFRVPPKHLDEDGNLVDGYADEIGMNSGKWPTENVKFELAEGEERAEEDIGRERINQPIPGELYYDYEGDCFWVLHEDLLEGGRYHEFLNYLEQTFTGKRPNEYPAVDFPLVVRSNHTRADFKYIVWGEETPTTDTATDSAPAMTAAAPLIMKMAPETRVLRDEQVYQTFGFNPMTGWGMATPNLTKFSFEAVNTAPFTTLEEFKSSVRRCHKYGSSNPDIGTIRSFSTSPVNNDTNGDGVPDGWASYVNYNPLAVSDGGVVGGRDDDCDGLTVAEEFACVAVNYAAEHYKALENAPAGWGDLFSEIHDKSGGGWTNKKFPTDPRNPDTDLDGLWDADEGDARYCYGPSYVTSAGELVLNSTRNITNGGGGDPNSKDTDGDGMIDGWEYRYGAPAVEVTVTTQPSDDLTGEGETDEETEEEENPGPSDSMDTGATETVNNHTASMTGRPDLTAAYDAGFDPDADGLPNLQEYLAGYLRHLRYDLLPDMSRLYADTPGVYSSTDSSGLWAKFPDIYTIGEDLTNPAKTYSIDFEGYDGEDLRIDPLNRAIASLSTVVKGSELTAARTIATNAVHQAMNRNWMRTMAFLTEEQISIYCPTLRSALTDTWPAYGKTLDPRGSNLDSALGMGATQRVTLLVRSIQALDAAYQRQNSISKALAANGGRDNRQILALVAQIDRLFAEIANSNSTVIPPALRTMVSEDGDGRKIWDARRAQILSSRAVDGAYAGMASRIRPYLDLADTEDNPYAGVWKPEPKINEGQTTYPYENAANYEKAVRSATDPLLLTQYRAALRGYSGGIWREKPEVNTDAVVNVLKPWKYYIGQAGLQTPVGNFGSRAGSVSTVLGTAYSFSPSSIFYPVSGGRVNISDYGDHFFTTSPLMSDTDLDGMDDYWEIFHGLNPMLGDYLNAGYRSGEVTAVYGSTIDRLSDCYSGALRADSNAYAFANADDVATLLLDAPTGFDYYTYPWLAGAPFADPDGDGLINAEEAVNPAGGRPEHYGTDPSPLWMTDADNQHSFVTRFYPTMNANVLLPASVYAEDATTGELTDDYIIAKTAAGSAENGAYSSWYEYAYSDIYPEKTTGIEIMYPATTASYFPYEVNEGFDTDGDGTPDRVELASGTVASGDPQSLRTPDRQQAAYFSGKGAMQSQALTQFGPTALTTFTVECWVNPDSLPTELGAGYEMILVDRPWSAMDNVVAEGSYVATPREALRHNFVLGLRAITNDTFVPFARFTGAGTSTEGVTSIVPAQSPTIAGSENDPIEAKKWVHLAVTYDGSTLALYRDGVQLSAQTNVGLIPANGVIALHNDGQNSIRNYTYRKAPILIGAGPANAWFADPYEMTAYDYLPNDEDTSAFETTPKTQSKAAYANCYFGFIDEVRIWNGARNAEQIAQNRSRSFTQAELLQNRLDVFLYRYSNGGFFAKNVPTELLAHYAFSDLLSGKREASSTEGENMPWERYPGEKTIGGETVPGSFLFRRKGLENTRALIEKTSEAAAVAQEPNDLRFFTLPEVEDIYSSAYSRLVHPKLQSTQYYMTKGEKTIYYTDEETETDPETGEETVTSKPAKVTFTDVPFTEAVPMAHNTVSHLPMMDVRFARPRDGDLFWVADIVSGSPSLHFPTGQTDSLKPVDSAYWTPHAAGNKVSATARYDVKTNANPYGHYYVATPTFDPLNFRAIGAYSATMATDLHIYGDVFAKYTYESWDNSATTDPSAGLDPNGGFLSDGTLAWFEYDPNKSGAANSLLTSQYSNGAAFFAGLFPNQTTDTDGDQMPNWWEKYYGLDPEDPIGVNGPYGDEDGDFLTNYAEYLATSNPKKYSTAGNGVPDYHMSIWARRGRPTFGLLYTDNDFMEDHWEAKFSNLSVDLHDPSGDRDGDGWSNWAEARATLRGVHSTDPNDFQENLVTGVAASYPTPTLQIEVDYFGPMSGMTNATNNIVVHTYTTKNNNSAPDAVFSVPMGVSSAGESEMTQLVGKATLDQTVTGYLRPGNIRPGTLQFYTYRYVPVSSDGSSSNGLTLGTSWFVRDNTKGELVGIAVRTETNPETDETKTYSYEQPIGTIDYRTGAYSYCFSSDLWSGGFTDDAGLLEDCYLQARYKTQYAAGFPAQFTLSSPISGHIREGINNFYVFMDLDDDGTWDLNEPAGVPDQHDVEIGFDKVNQTLHVELTQSAPPGSIRFDVGRILQELSDHVKLAEEQIKNNQMNPSTDSDDLLTTTASYSSVGTQLLDPEKSTIPHPIYGPDKVLNPKYFALSEPYELIVQEYQSFAPGNVVADANAVVYRKEYNVKKPYITEDEIFAYNPMGLGGSESNTLIASSYLVSLVPLSAGEDWTEYNLGLVTNVVGTMKGELTKMVSPIGGWLFRNNDITFEWTSTVQAVQMNLVINKTHDAHGNKLDAAVKVYDKSVRGVAATQQMTGDGAMEQYLYRYTLPRGVGELSTVDHTQLFGDGQYSYTLTLVPYAQQQKKVLSGNFSIQMNASGDKDLKETADTEDEIYKDTSYNTQDSYYVRTRVRYNGVLSESKDFNGRHIVIEAHHSASFNGDPVAATSDILYYDDDNTTIAAVNRCVRMVKDKVYTVDGKSAFFSTRFDAEIRGLVDDTPVYLVAYFDLNGNGKRDAWEPWGYATMGTDDAEGYYFDARSVTPVRSGTDYLAEFYIQDLDTDNDKLADTWEWISSGRPTGDFDTWCATYTGTLSNHQGLTTAGATRDSDIWTKNEEGVVALTAYGAQLYGLTATGTPDANGAVKVEGLPEDGEVAKDLINLVGQDTALNLFKDGYDLYALAIDTMTLDAEGSLTFTWRATASTGVEDGATYDLTQTFAGTKLASASYAIYGKASITDETWTKVREVKVAGLTAPTLSLGAGEFNITVDGETKPAQFFKVILTVKAAEAEITE